MNKYEKGKIYKIVNTIDDMIYIGSTVTNLSDRMGNHRSKAKMAHKNSKLYTHIKNLGVEHFKILLIKSFNCNNKDELEAEEYNEINIADKSKLLNENIVYKHHTIEHNKKVGDAQRGNKSHMFKFGSVFKRIAVSTDGYCIDSWCFSYILDGKCKRTQYSIKKYGDAQAQQMVLNKQKEIYPNM